MQDQTTHGHEIKLIFKQHTLLHLLLSKFMAPVLRSLPNHSSRNQIPIMNHHMSQNKLTLNLMANMNRLEHVSHDLLSILLLLHE